jgi:putative restriction endonuclease
MGKYTPLYDYLMRINPQTTELTLTFQQIEDIIDAKLPPSAHRHQEWWHNERGLTRHVQATAWLSAGWKADAVNQQRGWVRFRRL